MPQPDDRLVSEVSNLVENVRGLTVELRVLVEKMDRQQQDMSESKQEIRNLDGRLRGIELWQAEQKPISDLVKDVRKWGIGIILTGLGTAISAAIGLKSGLL